MKLVELSVVWEMDEVLGHLVPSELQLPSGVIEVDGTRLAWDIDQGHLGGHWRIEQDASHPLVQELSDMVSGVLAEMMGSVMSDV